MIVVTSRIRVVAGDADALAAQYADRLGLADGAPGCRSVEILRNVDAPAEFAVLTRWESRAAYDAYRRGPAFRASHERIARIPGGIRVERIGDGVEVLEVIA